MNVDEIQKVVVVGAGLMGSGIAQEFATNGYSTTLYDVSEESLNLALERIRDNLDLLAGFELISHEAKEEIVARVQVTVSMSEAVSDADFVVEAIIEDISAKKSVFKALDDICNPKTILMSTTSTIKPDILASATRRPDRVIVGHYGVPNYLIPLVEIARAKDTSDATADCAVALLEKMGKRPILMKKAMTGFIVNRLQMAMFREAFHIFEEGAATAEDIDQAVKNNFGLRLGSTGPLEFLDLAGVKTFKKVFSYVLPELSNSREFPQFLEEVIKQGHNGTTTGQGFHAWTDDKAEELKQRIIGSLANAEKARKLKQG